MKRRKNQLLEGLLEIAENLQASGAYFSDFEITGQESLETFSNNMKDLESKGDNIVHEVMVELNRSLITPLDQEDILALAEALDSVLDCLEEGSAFFYMYNYIHMDKYVEAFRHHIKQCTAEICPCIRHLSERSLVQIKKHTIKIKTIEEECDTIEREAIHALFQTEKDPIRLIKYKDLYHILESVVDSCQHVAKELDSIVMKNA